MIKIMREEGSVLFIVLVLLVVLSILGTTVSRIANTDLIILGHEGRSTSFFYIAEGGRQREAQEVGTGNYVVTDVFNAKMIAASDKSYKSRISQTEDPFEPASVHTISGEEYNFTVTYQGAYLPPAGYSVTDFSRYDYDINTWVDKTGKVGGKAEINSRYYTIGPKME